MDKFRNPVLYPSELRGRANEIKGFSVFAPSRLASDSQVDSHGLPERLGFVRFPPA